METKDLTYYQRLNLRANAVMGLVMAATSPIVHVQMIQEVSVDFYKFIAFLNELLVLIIFFYLDKRDEDGSPKIIKKLRLYFLPIVVCGCISFIAANFMGLIDVRVRFIIIASTEGIFGYLWKVSMEDLWNNLIHRTDLTAWINKIGKYDRLGAIVGATAILFITPELEVALGVQCLAYVYMGYCDYRIWKGTKDQAYA